jgi:Ca-activated chloride channel family protein
MSDFHFLRPAWFLALPILLLLIFWLARRQLRSRSWQAVCDPELLPHMLLGRSVRRANWPLWLLSTGLLLAILALAGPAWQERPQPLFRQQSALVILFDLSRSMLADDLKPNRFLRARLKIEDLLRQRQEGQTALIVFAADAFTVTPLTEDQHTIEALLKSLEPGIMPAQGSDPAAAIERGLNLLQQAGVKSGRILLVTDEDQPSAAINAAKLLAKQGFELAVLGVGSREGAPVPLPGGGFLKDAGGTLVIPRLDPSGLRRLANTGGGSYRTIGVDDSDWRALLQGLDDRHINREEPANPLVASTGDRWREEGIWLLWPLTLLAALAFRRGWLLVLSLVLLAPSNANAFAWADLWQTPDQQAYQAFKQGNFQQAAEQFTDPRWKVAALYRSEQFAAASKQLENPQTADDWYNRGNALAKAGHLPEALKAYQQALQREPAHADARINKEMVEEALRKEQQQKSPDGQAGKKQEQPPEGQDNASQNPRSFSEAPVPPSGEPSQQTDSEEGDDPSQEEGAAEQPAAVGEERQKSSQPAEKVQAMTGDEPADQSAGETVTAAEQPKTTTETAEQRETQLLLQQIPDDPGGLMRRKFLYQYRQRGRQSESERSW